MLQSAQGHQIIQTAAGQQIVVQSLPAGQQIQVRFKAKFDKLTAHQKIIKNIF